MAWARLGRPFGAQEPSAALSCLYLSQADGLGQDPPTCFHPQALKGRATETGAPIARGGESKTLGRPFRAQGVKGRAPFVPGRWPGLDWVAPLGLKNQRRH
jgi:hypothetical protein